MLEAILEAIFYPQFEVTCNGTGEVILWIVTLGRRKPFEIEKAGDLSTLIGALFWVLIAIAVAMVFLL